MGLTKTDETMIVAIIQRTLHPEFQKVRNDIAGLRESRVATDVRHENITKDIKDIKKWQSDARNLFLTTFFLILGGFGTMIWWVMTTKSGG